MTGFYQARSGEEEETEQQRLEKAMTMAANGVEINPETLKPIEEELQDENGMGEDAEKETVKASVDSDAQSVGQIEPDNASVRENQVSPGKETGQLESQYNTPAPEAATESEVRGESLPIRRAGLKHRRLGAGVAPKDGKDKRRKMSHADRKISAGEFTEHGKMEQNAKKLKKKSSFRFGAMLPVSRLGF